MAISKVLSHEDGNLAGPTIIGSRNKLYSDLDLTFAIKETGDLYKKTDAAAVRQSVKTILLTNFGESPFNHYFGGDIRSLLFDTRDQEGDYLASSYFSRKIDRKIRMAIDNYEPRAEVINVDVRASTNVNTVSCEVTFIIKSTQEEVALQITLSRIQ